MTYFEDFFFVPKHAVSYINKNALNIGFNWTYPLNSFFFFFEEVDNLRAHVWSNRLCTPRANKNGQWLVYGSDSGTRQAARHGGTRTILIS